MSHANGGSFPGTPANADEACGAKDFTALLPEPVHYECRACKAVIVAALKARFVAALKARVPPRQPEPPPVQEEMFDLQPLQRTKLSRGNN